MHEFTRELGARRRVRQTRGTRARRRSSALRDSACRPDAFRRRASLEEMSERARERRRSSREAASEVSLVLVNAMGKTRGGEGREEGKSRVEKTAEDRGTELRYNILAPAKRSSRDITTAMRTALPAAHARDGIASRIRPTAGGNGDGKSGQTEKEAYRMRKSSRRNEEREREIERKAKRGIKRGARRANSVPLPTYRWNAELNGELDRERKCLRARSKSTKYMDTAGSIQIYFRSEFIVQSA